MYERLKIPNALLDNTFDYSEPKFNKSGTGGFPHYATHLGKKQNATHCDRNNPEIQYTPSQDGNGGTIHLNTGLPTTSDVNIHTPNGLEKTPPGDYPVKNGESMTIFGPGNHAHIVSGFQELPPLQLPTL